VERPTPNILYRYRDLKGKNRDRVRRMIRESVLYFASPESFNDPFDCKVYYNSSGSLSDLRRKQQKLYKKYAPHLNRNERRLRTAKDMKQFNRQDFVIKITTGGQKKVNAVGILCLSENRDDVVLWSHYADSHKGLCLGFKVSEDQPFFARALPITYSTEFPRIDLINDPPDIQVEAFLLTKAEGWKYEQEWRIIDHDNGFGEKTFNKKALCEIIFGAKMSKDDKAFIYECVGDRESPVAILQSRPIAGSYALDIAAISP
jgi:hypothetical protein